MRNITSITTTKSIKFNGQAIANTAGHYRTMVEFVRHQMHAKVDYGTLPHVSKPILFKPGAEKLCRLFGLRPTFQLLDSVVDFDRPLFFYHHSCSLIHKGERVGDGEGSCNSKEKQYEQQAYKIYDLPNTICKMSQKRAFVQAVLFACGASQFFTQDEEFFN